MYSSGHQKGSDIPPLPWWYELVASYCKDNQLSGMIRPAGPLFCSGHRAEGPSAARSLPTAPPFPSARREVLGSGVEIMEIIAVFYNFRKIK